MSIIFFSGHTYLFIYVSIVCIIIFSAPIAYTLPEGAAKIFRLNLTKKQYQSERNDAMERNFGHVYPIYDDIRGYTKNHCRPIIYSDRNTTWSEVQANVDHQLGRQIQLDPKLEALCVARAVTGHDLSFLFKWGTGKDEIK